jgi:protein-serine/threonine kinase
MPAELIRKLRSDAFGLTPSTTVILRSPLKSKRRRSSMQPLKDSGYHVSSDIESIQSTDNNHSSQTAESTPRKVSVETVASNTSSRDGSQRRSRRRFLRVKSSPETLGTISESTPVLPRPTILSTEKAAATRIFMEMHFHELLQKPNSRVGRRRFLESQLYYSPHLSPEQKDGIRRSFFYHETCHLREFRVLKGQSRKRQTSKDSAHHWQNYEPLKILGKGSFGVVRLVREKYNEGHQCPKQVYAMKIIRKSEMLFSSQEGHLRAERDFLVASEGSAWSV